MLMPDKAIPAGKAQPLTYTGIERLPVIAAVAINPVPTAFEIVVKCFICLANFSLTKTLFKKKP